MKLHLSLLVILLMADACWSQCRMADWWTSFDSQGWSRCGSYEYVTGFYRSSKLISSDPIYRLQEARCCKALRPNRYTSSTCIYANWWLTLDRPNRWAVCPTGYFVKDLYRSKDDWIHNIEAASCCKPNTLPDRYGHCYNEDVWLSFDEEGTSQCNEGYYLAGIYRGSCDSLHCIEQFKCCRMRAA